MTLSTSADGGRTTSGLRTASRATGPLLQRTTGRCCSGPPELISGKVK